MRVVNLSLGHPIFEPAARDPLVQAVEAAVRKGLVVVVSAGNFGCLPHTEPVRLRRHHLARQRPVGHHRRLDRHPQTISRLDDGVTDYSSRGPSWYDGFAKPDLVAPGHRLVSSIGPSSVLGGDFAAQVVQAVTRPTRA